MAQTIIGPGLTIEGEITSEDEVTVAGTVRGRLSSEGPINVEGGAVIEADVSAGSLSVGGSITGNVAASDRVDLLTGGRLVGDVRTARITIQDGASFKGNVDMDV
jgi:cytoskeletal protein CcmA (bactofilin family)